MSGGPERQARREAVWLLIDDAEDKAETSLRLFRHLRRQVVDDGKPSRASQASVELGIALAAVNLCWSLWNLYRSFDDI